jgi:hypothetical protein
MDFFMPEYVNAVMAERSIEAEAARIAKEAENGSHEPRLRPRIALILGALAARIHPEAARHAVGLRAPPHGRLCLCDD